MASTSHVVLGLLALFFTKSHGADTYNAAVVEYSPAISNLQANVDKFKEYMKAAHEQSADIIVFPEIGLNGFGPCVEEMYTAVPDPKDKITPCDVADTYSKALESISCAAKDSKIYTVINIVEKVTCKKEDDPECPDTGKRLYNTNVVFDREGVVIARYRKFHLFNEPDKTVTAEPEISFFETDFGVTFGVFTCFDIMFDHPALDLVKEKGISDFVFPTAWFSELPYLTALQAQWMWSYANDVNLLAAGYNNVEVGSGGSGIYNGRKGPKKWIFPKESNILIAEVEKKSASKQKKENIIEGTNDKAIGRQWKNTKAGDEVHVLLKSEKIYSSVALTELEFNDEVCYDSFCCMFNVHFKDEPNSEEVLYRAAVFDGVRTFDGAATGGIQSCGIVSCSNNTVESCGVVIDKPRTFTTIEISGKFTANSTLIMPSTIQKNLYPIFDFTWASDCDEEYCSINMVTKEQSDLLTFGIYSRVFSRDGDEPSSATTSMIYHSLTFPLVTLLIVKRW